MIRETVIKLIEDYVEEYPIINDIETVWKKPLVGFVDVNNPIVRDLKNMIIETHQLPEDILIDAKTIIVYFIPYQESTANSNIKVIDNYVSREWAIAYKETNVMMDMLNNYLVNELNKLNYNAATIKDSKTISNDTLYSNWSHRHFAYCAGLGTFGINNMLITKNGCAGRFNSIVTSAIIDSGQIINEEYCLYKRDGSCGVCVNKCFANALDYTGFVREECSKMLQRNKIKYGSDQGACGKCVVGLPCTFSKP